MAENTLPDPIGELLDLADTMVSALTLHEVAIGLKQNLAATVGPAATLLRTAVTARDNAVGAQPDLTVAQTAAREAGEAFATLARDLLKPSLGGQWSQAWVPTGFKDNSLAVPIQDGPVETLLKDLQTYYTANPAKENAPAGVTAAAAGALATTLSNARGAVLANAKLQGETLNARNDAEKALRKIMKGLIGELEQKLPLGSPMWGVFGLNPPDETGAPGIPAGLTLTPALPGKLLAAWQPSANADHYRVFKQTVGVDPDFIHVASPADPDRTIDGLPTGATVKVRVTAVNEIGETQPSDVVEAVVG